MYLKINDNLLNTENYVSFLSRTFPVRVQKENGSTQLKNPDEANELVIKTVKCDLKKYRFRIENKHPKVIEDLRKKILLNKENNDILLSELERYLILKNKILLSDYKPTFNRIIEDKNDNLEVLIKYLIQIKRDNKFEILNKYIVKYFEYIFE